MRWFLLGMSLSSCVDAGSDKGAPEEPPAPPSPPPEVVSEFRWEFLDIGDCETPPPRRYHHVAGFVAPTFFEYPRGSGVRRTESGFLLFGGEDTSGDGDVALPGAPLDDLWVFDPAEVCPWTLLTVDADPGSDGTAHGHLFQSTSGDTFALVGGRMSVDGTWIERAQPLTLGSLRSTSFTSDAVQPGFSARHVRGGSPVCTMYPGGGTESFDCTCVPEEVAGVGVCPIRASDGTVTSTGTGLVYSRWRFGASESDLESRRAAVCEQARSGAPLGSNWDTMPDLLCEPGEGNTSQETSLIQTYGCELGCAADQVGDLFVSCGVDPFCADDAPLGADGAAVFRREHAWEGWYAAAGAVDPSARLLETYGGSAGCSGDCAGHPGVTLDDDLTRAQSLYATNRPGGSTWSAWVGSSATAWSEPWDGDRQFDETVGVRNAAMARFGDVWSPSTRSWTATDPARLLVGGTLQQDVEPSRKLELNDEFDESVVWRRFRGMEPDDDESATLVAALRRVSSGAPMTLGSTVPPGMDRAAASVHPDWVAILGGRPGDRLWVVGRGGEVRPDDEQVTMGLDVEIPAVYGAAGAHDPVRRSAYFFGSFWIPRNNEQEGHYESRVLRVWPVTAPAYERRARTLLDRVETRIAVRDPAAADPRAEPWDTTVATRFSLRCAEGVASGACWSRELAVTLSAGFAPASTDPASDTSDILDHLRSSEVSFELQVPGASEPVPLDVAALEQSGAGDGELRVVLRSPVALHGANPTPPLLYTLVVSGALWPVDGQAAEDQAVRPQWATFGADGPLCSPDLGWSLDHLPVILNTDVFGTTASARPESPWHSVEVLARDGYAVMGPMYTPTCAATTLLPTWSHPAPPTCFRLNDENIRHFPTEESRFHLAARPHTSAPLPVVAEDGARSWVWIDDCLDGDVRAVVDGWVLPDATSTARTYLSEQTWLADRVRSVATEGTERTLGLWIGRSMADDRGAATGAAGVMKDSFVQLMPFGPTGSREAREPSALAEALDAVATHELAHVALAGRKFPTDTKWFAESVSTLLQLERAPGFQSHALRQGLTLRQAGFVRDDQLTRPLRDMTRSEIGLPWLALHQQYTVGPYLLAQALAEGGVALADDASPAWRLLRSALLPTRNGPIPWGAEVTEADVDAALTLVGAGDFYEQRVLGARWGEPLVSARIVSVGGARTLEIQQVQDRLSSMVNLVPFDLHARAVWGLACALDAGGPSADLPFPECGAGGAGTVDHLRWHDGAAGVVQVALTVQPVDDSASWFGVFTGGQILPGQVGAFALLSGLEPALFFEQASSAPAAPTWWLDCAPGATAAACTELDVDGDGFVPAADCAILDPSTHRNADEPLATEDPWTVDHDCDGWPGDFQIDPTREVL